jgi:hypothetical protein
MLSMDANRVEYLIVLCGVVLGGLVGYLSDAPLSAYILYAIGVSVIILLSRDSGKRH